MPDNFQIENNILRVRNLKESNEGMYECIIVNGGVTENIFVTLNVKSKFKICSYVSSKNVANKKELFI